MFNIQKLLNTKKILLSKTLGWKESNPRPVEQHARRRHLLRPLLHWATALNVLFFLRMYNIENLPNTTKILSSAARIRARLFWHHKERRRLLRLLLLSLLWMFYFSCLCLTSINYGTSQKYTPMMLRFKPTSVIKSSNWDVASSETTAPIRPLL